MKHITPQFCVVSILVISLVACSGIDEHDNLDCSMRRLAYGMARRALSSWRRDNLLDIFDALELEGKCNLKNIQVKSNPFSRTASTDEKFCTEEQKTKASTYHVCPTKGNDLFSGNDTSRPFATVQRALEAIRSKITSKKEPHTIILHPGIHFLNETLALTSQDSFLTIRAACGLKDNEKPWISGGTLLKAKNSNWRQYHESRKGKETFTTSSNIWFTDLNETADITGIFTVDPHQRMTLARFPNANVEDWNAPNRHIGSTGVVKEWLFPARGEVPKMLTIDLSKADNPVGILKNDSTMEDYNKYGTGLGGVCASVWGDYPSYWCGNVSAGGWAFVDRAAALAGRLNIPRGIILKQNNSISKRMHNWKHFLGAIVHVGHTQGWAWHMFNVSEISPPQNEILFDTGGWQGGRNWQCFDEDGHLSDCDGEGKRLHGGDWYVEGILEELDEPGEFYFDREKRRLYFYPNHTIEETELNSKLLLSKERRKLQKSPPPDIIATKLETLISIKGTKDDPVQNVTIHGIGFRDAAKTYMEQWAAPSGGDWALYKGGAIYVDGAEYINLQLNKFIKLDGNAILLGGYTRYVTISKNEFGWIGNGAVATWGDTDDYDATTGMQPRFSLMESNLVHDVGLYQKQSSGWGQSKACQTVIRNNVMYNLPRAAINFNDGLGGDNVVERNVIFNTCRESGDHGPINSWDRMPFLSDLTGNFTALPSHTRHNLIFANYGASEGFDNDDGSSFYHTYKNVYYEADGFKMDYGGHDSKFTQNLVVASNRKHCYGSGSFMKSHSDLFEKNICLLINTNNDTEIGHTYQCSSNGLRLRNNTYYTFNGNGTFGCGNDILTLKEMQNIGLEVGSNIRHIPKTHEIISWAKRILRG